MFKFLIGSFPPASEASREVANSTEIKKIHKPRYMVSKNLSVCLSVTNFDPNYQAEQSGLKFF